MSRRQQKQGKLARSVLKMGDIDAGGASARDRLALIDPQEDAVMQNAMANAEIQLGNIAEKVDRLQQRIESREARRHNRGSIHTDRVANAAAWRRVGVQETYTQGEAPTWLRFSILLIVACLDFYIFAQAYAYVDNAADGSWQWWLGGILGMAVFISSVVVARQVKDLQVGHAQRRFLKEREESMALVDKHLIPMRSSLPILILSTSVFLSLTVVGIIVRLEGSDQEANIAVITMQGLIPLLAIAVELYLYDPLLRRSLESNIIDSWLLARKARWEARLERRRVAFQAAIERVRAAFEYERRFAKVEMADLGMPDLPENANELSIGTPSEISLPRDSAYREGDG